MVGEPGLRRTVRIHQVDFVITVSAGIKNDPTPSASIQSL